MSQSMPGDYKNNYQGDYAEHDRDYRGFVRGVWLVVSFFAVLLLLLAFFLL
jgi:hypothetical protein